ncbi:MAG: hypothetical protein ABIS50_00300 [Luteolibacter sp.]|uniref:hypothetical protein n=1 Tax=Luteolibacter sp. TaxID=1962973 RepID=UPI0032650E31
MSDREKKLLIFFGIAGFVIINFLGFNIAQAKQIKVKAENAIAQQELAKAHMIQDSSEQVTDQMEWLAKNEPEPAENQEVQTKLQQVVERAASETGLTIKPGQKPLPTDTTGTYYHRAKIQIAVTGTEDALYRWFDKLNVPEQLRMASQIRLSPNTQDDTKIDCTATVEQWFVPSTS